MARPLCWQPSLCFYFKIIFYVFFLAECEPVAVPKSELSLVPPLEPAGFTSRVAETIPNVSQWFFLRRPSRSELTHIDALILSRLPLEFIRIHVSVNRNRMPFLILGRNPNGPAGCCQNLDRCKSRAFFCWTGARGSLLMRSIAGVNFEVCVSAVGFKQIR